MLVRMRLFLLLGLMVCLLGPARAQTWFPAVDDNFTRANTALGGAGSTNVGSPALGPAAGWIDVKGSIWQISANILQGKADAGQFTQDWLLRPSGEACLNQRVVVTAATGSTASSDWWSSPRYIDGSNFYVFNWRKITGTTIRIDLYRYLAGSLTLLGASSSIAYDNSHVYTFDCSAVQDTVDTTRTLLNGTITDVTSAATISIAQKTDSSAALQAAGRSGLTVNDSSGQNIYARAQIYNSPTTSITAGTSSLTLSATAAGGAYFPCTAQWYRSTTCNFAPGGGNTLGSAQTISSIVNFANVVDSTALPDTLYFYKCVISDSQGTPQTVTTSQTAARIYASPSPVVVGFIGDSTYGQVSNSNLQMYYLSLGGATGGTFTLTFGVGGTVTTSAIAYNATADTIQKALALLTNIGSAVTVTGSGGNFQVIITQSGVSAMALTGTSSLTGGIGSLAVTSFAPDETAPSIMSRLMQTRFGIRSSVLTASANSYGGTNQGQGGTTSASFLSGSANLIAAKAAFASAGAAYVMIDLGINDGRNSVANSTAAYQSNIVNIVTDLVGAGYKVVLNYPGITQQASGGDYDLAAGARQQGYQSAISTIVANFAVSNPGAVYLGDTRWWQYMCLHPTTEILSTDLIHPNSVGARVKAQFMADRVAQILGMIPGSAKRKTQ